MSSCLLCITTLVLRRLPMDYTIEYPPRFMSSAGPPFCFASRVLHNTVLQQPLPILLFCSTTPPLRGPRTDYQVENALAPNLRVPTLIPIRLCNASRHHSVRLFRQLQPRNGVGRLERIGYEHDHAVSRAPTDSIVNARPPRNWISRMSSLRDHFAHCERAVTDWPDWGCRCSLRVAIDHASENGGDIIRRSSRCSNSQTGLDQGFME